MLFMAMNIENGELLAVKQVPIESQTDKRMLQREISLMRSMSVRSDNRCVLCRTELLMMSSVYSWNTFLEEVSKL